MCSLTDTGAVCYSSGTVQLKVLIVKYVEQGKLIICNRLSKASHIDLLVMPT